jgi:dsDNA-binding SOS-regulon protein
MAVIAVWQCDRDGSMFQDKKEAEEYDKMLELAENISQLLDQHVPGASSEHNEAIGLFLAKHRDLLARACKGKPELLLEEIAPAESSGKPEPSDSKVAQLAAKG